MKTKLFWILVLVFFVNIFNIPSGFSQIYNESTLKFGQFLNIVNSYYVDTLNQDKFVDQAIINSLKSLDPHSVYIAKKDVRAINEPLEGNFEGIGVSYTVMEDTVWITGVHKNGPAERAGVRSGDRLMKINGENIASIGIKIKGVKERLQGRKDSQVNLVVYRKSEKKDKEFKLSREKIQIKSVEAAYKVAGNIGYIKLMRFSANSVDEFKAAIQQLKKQGCSKLILDLRDNGGGYLNVAVLLADEFLADNKMIVYTEGSNSVRTENKAEIHGEFEKGELAVLIDEGSASASEILAGAIQDWDRGVLIGRRSFGKGLVQRSFPMRDGSMIRLTIAKYFTPTGRSIQKPYLHGDKEYKEEIKTRYSHGEMTSADSIRFPDSLKYSTLTHQRIVYGGGGIMPDFFIPLDTSLQSPYYSKLISSSVFNNFIIRYIDENRVKLQKKYSDFAKFDKSFIADEPLLEKLYAFAEKNNIERKPKDIELSKVLIKTYMKALLANFLWTESEFYQVMNRIAPSFQKAIDVLNNEDLYSLKLCSK